MDLRIDWPLVVLLAVIFVVSSVVRWRYFSRRFGGARRPPPDGDAPPS